MAEGESQTKKRLDATLEVQILHILQNSYFY
jgi:hypothetical protein